ncbi:beta-N-acetylhexosaminidase [Thiolapillus brandeum]|uniref:Beta-hexosaminidase n=1 Tax=Thiolapillus brandeum TaxID=1076588 RepID=A0A7U6GI42_9GAMM|nr:beta-N-acetylhexosaminidase [Thiolapillus brandeum]BAO44066.1 beta-N-acetylhexosaminidase [Thiolapillus brandeum]
MTHGPLMLDLESTILTAEERERLLHPAVGGVILFTRNYESPRQLETLVTEIHQLRSPALLVAVDQEGGRVQRFREGFTELPSASTLGTLYRQHPQQALDAARHLGWLMATELRATGVDFSFAPVLDLQTDISRVIGDRAFSSAPTIVGKLAFQWARGAREGGMPSVGKHYPGHGCVEADSHVDLPVDERHFSELWDSDLLPFRHMIANGIEALMPAHVIYANVDDKPAGYSQYWIQEVLRQRMAFQGVVFSDDLSMAAAGTAGTYAERAAQALDAGCDMILVCNNPQGAEQVLASLNDYCEPVSQARMARMHGKGHPDMAEIREDPRWRQAMDYLNLLEAHDSLDLELE